MIQAGLVTRERQCEKHNGRLYAEMCFPDSLPDVWTGRCDLCEKQERLEQQARAVLATRLEELRRRIQEQLREFDGKDLERQVDELIEAEAQRIVDAMEARRPEFEAEVKRRFWESVEQNVESEMLAEIVEQLRKGNSHE